MPHMGTHIAHVWRTYGTHTHITSLYATHVSHIWHTYATHMPHMRHTYAIHITSFVRLSPVNE